MLRSISKLKECYLIALLDCTRVDWDPEIMQEVDCVSCDLEDATGPQNLILIYGCEPARQVNANSCLIPSFLRRVESSKLENNAIVLPGLLHNFRSLNNGEAVVTVDIDLHLYGPNPLAPVVEESKEPQGPTEEETKGDTAAGQKELIKTLATTSPKDEDDIRTGIPRHSRIYFTEKEEAREAIKVIKIMQKTVPDISDDEELKAMGFNGTIPFSYRWAREVVRVVTDQMTLADKIKLFGEQMMVISSEAEEDKKD